MRVRRTLAECLTSDEVRKRMREDEAHKQATRSKKVRKTPKAVSTKIDESEVVIDASKKKPRSVRKQRERDLSQPKKTMVIRKPTWLQGKGQQEATVPDVTTEDCEPDTVSPTRE
jgi:hypothetical protein